MKKFKGFINRCKVAVCTAIAACTTAVVSVCASAATTEAQGASDMSTVLTDAGSQLTTMFGDMVTTIIPVIIGILGSGLVIFGIFALIKISKKIFGKVAG